MNKQIPVEQVQAGQIVFAHGYKWKVNRNEYDPKGNTGNQPRHVLYCDAVEQSPTPPDGYIKDMSLGMLVGTMVTLDEPK